MTDTPTRRSGRLRGLTAVQTVFGMDEMLMMIFQHVDNVTVVTVLVGSFPIICWLKHSFNSIKIRFWLNHFSATTSAHDSPLPV